MVCAADVCVHGARARVCLPPRELAQFRSISPAASTRDAATATESPPAANTSTQTAAVAPAAAVSSLSSVAVTTVGGVQHRQPELMLAPAAPEPAVADQHPAQAVGLRRRGVPSPRTPQAPRTPSTKATSNPSPAPAPPAVTGIPAPQTSTCIPAPSPVVAGAGSSSLVQQLIGAQPACCTPYTGFNPQHWEHGSHEGFLLCFTV